MIASANAKAGAVFVLLLDFSQGYCIGELLSSSACRVKAAARCLAVVLVGIKAEGIKEIKAQECLSGVVQVDLGLQ